MGDWPSALVLDEVWLRCRRTVVESLEARRVWPGGDEHAAALAGVIAQGVALREGVLREVLGEDAALLRGESVFGAANRPLRRRLPQVLTFGDGLGRGFAALARAGAEGVERAAEAGALFNLGVSVLDLIHDTSPDLATALPGRIDFDALRLLAADPAGANRLAAMAQTPIDERGTLLPAEIRVLLALVAAFYARVHSMTGPGELPGPLAVALTDAYAAEMMSVAGADGDPEAARASSLAPFLVLAEVALVVGEPAAREPVLDLARAVGEVFWLVDDLMDVVSDSQTGSLNALIAGTGQPSVSAPAALLRGRQIEDFAERLGDAVGEVGTLLDEPGWPAPEAAALRQLVGHGVRSWME